MDCFRLQEAVDNVGLVDDGTESLGDVPSLSEEITGIAKDEYFSSDLSFMHRKFLKFWLLLVISGAAGEFKPGHISVETVLSEEGHQVGTQKATSYS